MPDEAEGMGSSSTGAVEPESSGGATSGDAVSSSGSSSEAGTTDPAVEESSSEDGGFIAPPDVGGGASGVCLGVTEVGHLGTVATTAAEPAELTCAPTPSGCGGDVVGSWTIASHCGLESLPNFFENDCDGSTMEVIASEVEGTFTFDEDGGYAFDTSLLLDLDVGLDTQSCYGIDCGTFADILNDEDNNLEAACEAAEEGGCSCLMTITNERTDTGTWDVDGDNIVFTNAGQEQEPIPLCVQGDRLELWEPLHESQLFESTPCDTPADCEDALGDLYETWRCLEL